MLSLTINLLNKYIFDFIYNTRILLKIIATGLGVHQMASKSNTNGPTVHGRNFIAFLCEILGDLVDIAFQSGSVALKRKH